MARIAGVNIPNHQHAEIALTAIYGIGRPRAKAICVAAGIKRLGEDQGPVRRGHGQAARAGAEVHRRGRPAPRGDDEHQAADGPRLLPRRAAPPRAAGSRPAHAHERAHAQGPEEVALAACSKPRAGRASNAKDNDRMATATAAPEGRRRARARRSRRTWPKGSRTSTRPSTTRSSRSPTGRATRCRGRRPAAPASRARASRRRSRRRSRPRRPAASRVECGVKNLEVRIKGPGPGPRIGGARAERARHQDHAASRT